MFQILSLNLRIDDSISSHLLMKNHETTMNRVKKILTEHKNAVIMAATIALIVIACSFAVYLRLYTGKELWYEMFAAIIGVIITAIITMMLLVGQTDSDERREKKGKVFEEKLRIYQEYLETLYNVIKAGQNTNDEKLKLAFKTSSVAMHCDPERVEEISKSVERIFKLAINANGNALETLSEAKWKELLKELFNVMDQFKADLYQNINKGTISGWDDTLKHFTAAFCQDSDDKIAPQALAVNTTNNMKVVDSKSITGEWEEKKKQWNVRGWEVEDHLAERNSFTLRLTSSDAGGNRPAYVSVDWDRSGHYNVQASYWRDPNFAKYLKSRFGGRRSYGTWWMLLEKEYYHIPEGGLYSRFAQDEKFSEYIYEWVDRLVYVVEQEHFIIQWLDAVGLRKDWTINTWECRQLVCDYDNEKYGMPYFDVTREGGQAVIRLTNRKEDKDLADELAKKMRVGLKVCGDGIYELETLDENSNDIPQRVREWMERIERATR